MNRLNGFRKAFKTLLFSAAAAPLIFAGSASAAEPGAPVVMDAMMSRDVPLTIKAQYNAKSKWVPQMDLGIAFDEWEDDDILIIQHYKGHGKKAKKWGKAQKCKDSVDGSGPTRSFQQKLVFFNCKADESLLIGKGGKYSAKITYRQTGMGVDHKDIRTIEYLVDEFHVDASGQKKQKGFIVNLDHRLGEGWLGIFGKGEKQSQDVRFSTWLKWDTSNEPHNVKMRCYLGKKKVGVFNSHNRHDSRAVDYRKKGADAVRTAWGKYVFHVKPDFGKGDVKWAPPTKKDAREGTFYLSKNPGDYRCNVTFDGESIREFKFTIAADGTFAEPACVGTTVQVPNQHHMMSVTVKEGLDPNYDKKAYGKSAWYGVGGDVCK